MSSNANEKESGKRQLPDLTPGTAFKILKTWHENGHGMIKENFIDDEFTNVPTQDALISMLETRLEADAKQDPRMCSKCYNTDVNTIGFHGCVRMHRLCINCSQVWCKRCEQAWCPLCWTCTQCDGHICRQGKVARTCSNKCTLSRHKNGQSAPLCVGCMIWKEPV